MADWSFPSFILLWDRHWEGIVQQGFFQIPDYPKPDYVPLNHPSDLRKINELIEENIQQIDVDSAEEARRIAQENRLPLYGDSKDHGHYYMCRYHATVHGVPDEKWMTDFVNGELTNLREKYGLPFCN